MLSRIISRMRSRPPTLSAMLSVPPRHDRQLLVLRLPFDDRLRGGERDRCPIVAFWMRIEVHVLVLQRVHELVRDRDADVFSSAPFTTYSTFVFGIVVADDLLGEHAQEELAQVQRVGKQPEQLVRRLLAGELLRPASSSLNFLRRNSRTCSLRAHLDLRRRLELQPRRRSRSAESPRRLRGVRAVAVVAPAARQATARRAIATTRRTAATRRSLFPFHSPSGHEADDARDVVAAHHDALLQQLPLQSTSSAARVRRRSASGSARRRSAPASRAAGAGGRDEHRFELRAESLERGDAVARHAVRSARRRRRDSARSRLALRLALPRACAARSAPRPRRSTSPSPACARTLRRARRSPCRDARGRARRDR